MLTVYGIETLMTLGFGPRHFVSSVATVLTVYGIETNNKMSAKYDLKVLQQCLPFTVLKQSILYNAYLIILSCNSAYRLRY